MRLILIATCILLLTISPALAWSEAGHRIIASIAFRQLTSFEQQRVLRVLSHHPRFREDFDQQLPNDFRGEGDAVVQAEWMLQQASIWPDKARGFKGELHAEFHRSTWHYINVPQFLTDQDRAALEPSLKINLTLTTPTTPDNELNVVQTIRLARSVLADRRASDADKALMLTWLCHTVGDIHQPLHSTALFSRKLFPEGDRGGNLVLTTQRKNLHSLWDQFPGDHIEFKATHDHAVKMLNDRRLNGLGHQATRQLDEKTWLDESLELARTQVYTAEILGHLRQFEADPNIAKPSEITLSEAYLANGGHVAEQRVIEAGFRLGAVLKQVVQ